MKKQTDEGVSISLIVKKACWGLLCLSLIVLLAACGTEATNQPLSSNSVAGASLGHSSMKQSPTPTPNAPPPLSIPSQRATPTPKPPRAPHTSAPPPPSGTASPRPVSSCITFSHDATLVPAKNGTLAAPYGPAPVSAEAQQLAQQLLQLVNSNRAACGLAAFSWNSTLASGALLHSWNMAHCGFSHTCPDGMTQYQRIANEGFAGLSDCGENIGEAGPYPTAWAGVSSIQESMANEPLGGWHRIHLFSTTLHRIGIGVYVEGGSIWFTEDMTS
jgi:uncharacterized protein YkwD